MPTHPLPPLCLPPAVAPGEPLSFRNTRLDARPPAYIAEDLIIRGRGATIHVGQTPVRVGAAPSPADLAATDRLIERFLSDIPLLRAYPSLAERQLRADWENATERRKWRALVGERQ